MSEKIKTEIAVFCPYCQKQLSIRDLNDFLKHKKTKITSSLSGFKHNSLVPKSFSKSASVRIMKEFYNIQKSNPKKNGYSVEMINDNVYHWSLKLFDFDMKDQIAKDLKRMGRHCVELSITFPPTYPFSPPFIRVIRPRFGRS